MIRDVAALLPLVSLTVYDNIIVALKLGDKYSVPALHPYVFIPAASQLVSVEIDVGIHRFKQNGKEYTMVKAEGGFVRAVDFTGRLWRMPIEKMERFKEFNVVYEGWVKRDELFEAKLPVYEQVRFEGGKYFAAYLTNLLRKHGVVFKKREQKRLVLEVGREPYTKKIGITVTVYDMKYGGRVVSVPGIVPGLIFLVKHGVIESEQIAEARDYLRSILDTVKDFVPAEPLVTSISRTRYMYAIAEAEGKDTILLYRKARDYTVVAKSEDGLVKLVIDYRVPPKPSNLLLKLVGFNLLPLAALMNEFNINALMDEIAERAEKRGVEVKNVMIGELSDITDIRVKHSDIVKFLWRGLPRLEDVENFLKILERAKPALTRDVAEFLLYGGIQEGKVEWVKEIYKEVESS